jgi:hypothetical protein
VTDNKDKKPQPTKKIEVNCDSCYHFIYDEDWGEYVCEVNLDEDERLLYSLRQNRSCPYYQFNDEYLHVRKQN